MEDETPPNPEDWTNEDSGENLQDETDDESIPESLPDLICQLYPMVNDKDTETEADSTNTKDSDDNSSLASLSSLEFAPESDNEDDSIILMANDDPGNAVVDDEEDEDTIIYPDKVSTNPIEILGASRLISLKESDQPWETAHSPKLAKKRLISHGMNKR